MRRTRSCSDPVRQEFISRLYLQMHSNTQYSRRYEVGVEDVWTNLITNRLRKISMKENQNKMAKQVKSSTKKNLEITNYMTRGWWEQWNSLTILHIFVFTVIIVMQQHYTVFLSHVDPVVLSCNVLLYSKYWSAVLF